MAHGLLALLIATLLCTGLSILVLYPLVRILLDVRRRRRRRAS